MNVEIVRQNFIILFWDNEAEQFHFWIYINRKQTFVLDSHRPFISSVFSVTANCSRLDDSVNRSIFEQ